MIKRSAKMRQDHRTEDVNEDIMHIARGVRPIRALRREIRQRHDAE